MRGILIDPFTKCIAEVDVGIELEDIYDLLKCETFTIVNIDNRDCIFLDDEGLLVPNEYQAYWEIAGANQPYAGRGLILGTGSDGETIGARTPLEKITSLVTFVDRENVDPDQYIGHKIFVMEDGEWKEI